jgi:hypothetical protein
VADVVEVGGRGDELSAVGTTAGGERKKRNQKFSELLKF